MTKEKARNDKNKAGNDKKKAGNDKKRFINDQYICLYGSGGTGGDHKNTKNGPNKPGNEESSRGNGITAGRNEVTNPGYRKNKAGNE